MKRKKRPSRKRTKRSSHVVAVAERGGSGARYRGVIRNDLEEVARFSKMMGDPHEIA